MKKYQHLIILTLITILLTACGVAAPTEEVAADEPIPTDPDQTIEVKAGEEFTITLETNPNTGLHWEVAVELDATILDLNSIKKEFIAKTDREDSPGWDIWTFRAIAPGETTITLGYYRGFTDVASRTVVFNIVVK